MTHYKVLGRKEDTDTGLNKIVPASTRVRDKGGKNGISLVSLRLETGRTHQIRVHMTSIGHPLLGDFLYNPTDDRMSRQALHAWHLSFVHPITKDEMNLEAPIPEDMKKFWEV